MIKVVNLCDYCAHEVPICESSKAVFAVDCKDIVAYAQAGEVDKKYLDATIACDKFEEKSRT